MVVNKRAATDILLECFSAYLRRERGLLVVVVVVAVVIIAIMVSSFRSLLTWSLASILNAPRKGQIRE